MWRQTTVEKWISSDKFITYLSNNDKTVDRKAFVATTVANVATERMGLDTTDVDGVHYKISNLFHSKIIGLHEWVSSR